MTYNYDGSSISWFLSYWVSRSWREKGCSVEHQAIGRVCY